MFGDVWLVLVHIVHVCPMLCYVMLCIVTFIHYTGFDCKFPQPILITGMVGLVLLKLQKCPVCNFVICLCVTSHHLFL